MGIYSGRSYGDSFSVNVPERDLFAECGYNATFEEISLMMVAESEQNYNNIMKAIALDELAYMEEYGTEIIYEASGIKGIFDKIKAFFQKLIEKVQQVLHAFLAKMDSFFKDAKGFASKYEKEFSRKWADVKGDFEFKGFKFTVGELKDKATDLEITDTVAAALTETFAANNTTKIVASELAAFTNGNETALKDIISKGNVDALKTMTEHLKDDKEDIEEGLRGAVAKKWVEQGAGSNSSYSVDSQLSASEFSDTLFEAFRDGENAKDSIEKSELSVSEIVGDLKTGDKWKQAATKSCNKVQKCMRKIIKDLEKIEKHLVSYNTKKDIPTYTAASGASSSDRSTAGKANKTESDILSLVLSCVSKTTEFTRFASQLYTQANGIYLQAIDDRERQNKAIMVKVIGSGLNKNMTESYNYDYDSGYQGSFIENVVLK